MLNLRLRALSRLRCAQAPSPAARSFAALGERGRSARAFDYPAGIGGTGNTVTDLIFSIANRDVTFFNATALISFL